MLLLIQFKELPKLPNTMFFTDDAYFVGDRIVRNYARKNNLRAPVHAYPGAVFRMFGGYSKLGLIDHSPAWPPKPGRFYLIHKPQIIRAVRSARIRKQNDMVKYGEELLRRDPSREYLIETASIALIYIHDPAEEPVVDIADYPKIWHAGNKTEEIDGPGIDYEVDKLKSDLYLSMFSSTLPKPTPMGHPTYEALQPKSHYRVEIKYRLKKPFTHIRFYIREYDEKDQLGPPSTQFLTRRASTNFGQRFRRLLPMILFAFSSALATTWRTIFSTSRASISSLFAEDLS